MIIKINFYIPLYTWYHQMENLTRILRSISNSSWMILLEFWAVDLPDILVDEARFADFASGKVEIQHWDWLWRAVLKSETLEPASPQISGVTARSSQSSVIECLARFFWSKLSICPRSWQGMLFPANFNSVRKWFFSSMPKRAVAPLVPTSLYVKSE